MNEFGNTKIRLPRKKKKRLKVTYLGAWISGYLFEKITEQTTRDFNQRRNEHIRITRTRILRSLILMPRK